MKNNKENKIRFSTQQVILAFIILLAFLLRVFKLSEFPIGFSDNEASFAYDSYSILITGKDQWGNSLPLMLETFGDYLPALTSYLSMPFVWSLGLVKIAVRLPNALLGTAAVYLVYLLAGEIKRYLTPKDNSRKLEILAALLLAVSPWHIQISRIGVDGVIFTFLLPLGILLFLKGLKNPAILNWSGLVFGINLLTHPSSVFITLLLILVLVITFIDKIREIQLRNLLTPAFTLLFFMALAFYAYFVVNPVKVETAIVRQAASIAADDKMEAIRGGLSPTAAGIFHNKYTSSAGKFLENYTSYISFNFLFSRGPLSGTNGMVPGQGMLYWFEFPLITAFLYALLRSGSNKIFLLLVLWILAAPVYASLFTGPGDGRLSSAMMPAIQIVSAFGALQIFILLKQRVSTGLLQTVKVASLVILAVFMLLFLEKYFVLSASKIGSDMQAGNLEAAYWMSELKDRKSEIVISTNIPNFHIFVAFAERTNPSVYQDASRNWNYRALNLKNIGHLPEYRLENYIFKKIDWNLDMTRDAYIVAKPEETPASILPAGTIYYPDGKPAIYIIEPNIKNYAKAY
jgi:4-amino-4-deoxy-L-arabinose transferase-like glycosyltransferase